MVKTTVYRLPPRHTGVSFRAAVAADLHGDAGKEALLALDAAKPDLILMPGDLSDRLIKPRGEMTREERKGLENGLSFLRSAMGIAPVFYSPGNHEMGGMHSGRPWADKCFPPYAPIDREIAEAICATGTVLLDNDYLLWQGMAIGGLSSALTCDGRIPDLAFLERFDALDGYKILLCHHPEYYPLYLQRTTIDLVVSGHAHGGQWSFFGQAVFAPGQGLFPSLVRGVHDGRLVISRGMTNNAWVPRIGVPREILMLEVGCPYNINL